MQLKINAPMNSRGLIAYAHDLIMTALSFGIALYLRIGTDIFDLPRDHLFMGAGTLTLIGAVVYFYTGLYRGIWSYASIRDLSAIAKAASMTVLLFLLVMFLWTRLEDLPRSLPFINWLVLMAMLGGPRLAYRIIRDRRLEFKNTPDGKRRIPVLLVGASDGADIFIRSLSRLGASEYRVVGIVAEKDRRVGQHIHGITVMDTIDNLSGVVTELAKSDEKPQRLILTKDTFEGAVVRRLFNEATDLGLTIARMPDVTEFKSSDPDKIEIQPIDVEDLLGRPQANLDRDAMGNLIKDRRVLITGAGGSIGSELVRQISDFAPSEIAFLEASEFALYTIDMEIAGRHPGLKRQSIIANVRDEDRLELAFEAFKPELVFHAAALKHVPLVEENACEGVMTNVFGTINVAQACLRHNVTAMVQVSTDKAINPTNVMGTTKRIAEQYCQALDIANTSHTTTNFVTVRFGNVLGSTGSVVPLFQKQLEKGGPLTVTHPDMTRYFMTIREAVELILLASSKARPGSNEDGKIFVLDMGDPVKILDLAQQMIRLAGFEPDQDIKIDITGLRPGEKLFEEVFHAGEDFVQTQSEGILLAAPRITAIDDMNTILDKLKPASVAGNEAAVRAILSEMVPEATIPEAAPNSVDKT